LNHAVFFAIVDMAATDLQEVLTGPSPGTLTVFIRFLRSCTRLFFKKL